MLYGRRAQCDALERLLADARRSRSGVLVVRGEAGAGKSALLDHAAGLADGMAVLRADGVESEAELPFAALHQLLRPVLGLAGRLPGPQAAALGGALGFGPPGGRGSGGLKASPPEGRDRFLVSVAVLSVLGEAAEDRPVLCLVDEAQWLDRSSPRRWLCRARLEAEGVVCLFAPATATARLSRRPACPSCAEGWTGAAAALLAGGWRRLRPRCRPPGRADRGNPAGPAELPRSLAPEQLAGRAPLGDVLPLTTRWSGPSATGSVACRPGPDLLLVAAAEANGDRRCVLRAGPASGSSRVARGLRAAGCPDRRRRLAFRHRWSGRPPT